MKRLRLSLFFPTLFILPILILSACNFGAKATDVAQTSSQQDASQSAAATTVPVDLAGPQAGTQMYWADNSILVYVPETSFVMGADGADNPKHNVTLSSYWIYQSEVTNREYSMCMQTGNCSAPAGAYAQTMLADPLRGDDPVISVTWDQASAYCTWIDGTLPTEAQWELAARGPDSSLFPWGDAQPSCDLLNFGGCLGTTSKVDNYPGGKSFYNALDMAGNVLEWMSDWYDPNFYTNSPDRDPYGPDSGQARSIRSSSFLSTEEQVPPSTRFFQAPSTTQHDLGFRCVVEKPALMAPACQTSGIAATGCSAVPFSGVANPACNTGPRVVHTVSGCNQGNGYGVIQVVGSFELGPGGTPGCTLNEDTITCYGDTQHATASVCDVSVLQAPPSGAVACPIGYAPGSDGSCRYSGACPVGFAPGAHGCEPVPSVPPVLVPVVECQSPQVSVPGVGCVDPASCALPQVFVPGAGCVDTPICTPPDVYVPGSGCVSTTTIQVCTPPEIFLPFRGCVDPIADVLENCPMGLYNASGSTPAVCLPPEPIGCAIYNATTGRDCLVDAFNKDQPQQQQPPAPAPSVDLSSRPIVPPALASYINEPPKLPNLCPAGTYFDTGSQGCVPPSTGTGQPGMMGQPASCLAGFGYNTTAMCCQGPAYSSCPAGQAMNGGTCAPVGNSRCSDFSVTTGSCGSNPGGNDNPGGNNPGGNNPGTGCDADHPYTCTNGVCGCAPG